MFRCQFSGEFSEPSVYKNEWVHDENYDGCRRQVRVLVRAAEKPVKLAIEFRTRVYENYSYDSETGRRFREEDSYGREIVREITVRAKHLEAVKKKFGLV